MVKVLTVRRVGWKAYSREQPRMGSPGNSRGSPLNCWQSDGESRALSNVTVDGDQTLNLNDEVFHDGQSKPSPAFIARSGRIDAIEPLKNPWLVLLCDPYAVIFD